MRLNRNMEADFSEKVRKPQRITILDQTGAEVCTTWATRKDGVFRIRYRPDLLPGMLIKVAGDHFRIVAVTDGSTERSRRVRLHVEEIRTPAELTGEGSDKSQGFELSPPRPIERRGFFMHPLVEKFQSTSALTEDKLRNDTIEKLK